MPSNKKLVMITVSLSLLFITLIGATIYLTFRSYREMASIKESQTQEAQFLLSTLDFKTEQQKSILFIRDVILKEWSRISSKQGSYDRAFTISTAIVRESVKYPYMEFPQMALLMTAMLKKESCFMDSAVSAHGARGIAQFMPSTARMIAGRIQIEYTDTLLFDVETAIRLQGVYLDVIFASNNYKIEPSLAEYNGGTWGAIYWKTDKTKLAPETRDYVPSIMQTYREYQVAYTKYQVSLKAADSPLK